MLETVLKRIQLLKQDNNLAAVVIHLNDTYIIEERVIEEQSQQQLELPGFARVVAVINEIREAARSSSGEDRTLVVHSGDFLGPSLSGKQLKGKAMIDMLNRCGVQFATLGNHEFDYGMDVLEQRLQEANFKVLLANLDPPKQYNTLPQKIEKWAFWPKENPILAITGIMGEESAKAAKEFRLESPAKVLKEIFDEKKYLGPTFVLSHCTRSEDREIMSAISRSDEIAREIERQSEVDIFLHKGQKTIDKFKNLTNRDAFVKQDIQRRNNHGHIIILGGHDHNISWIENDLIDPNISKSESHILLSKNLSNCRTIRVFVISLTGSSYLIKEQISHLDRESMHKNDETISEMRRNLPSDDIFTIGEHSYRVENDFSAQYPTDFRAIVQHLPRQQQDAIEYWFKKGFNLVKEQGYSQDTIPLNFLWHVLEYTPVFAKPFFNHELIAKDLERIQPDTKCELAIKQYLDRLELPSNKDEVVKDFRSPDTKYLDAQDESLRTIETDFGNFVADCVKYATKADVALINSGSFRADSNLPALLRFKDLYETFLFDCPRAVMTIEMSLAEYDAFLDHSRKKAGEGAFLQISIASPSIHTQPLIKVALTTYIVTNNFDGFVRLLADSRSKEVDQIIEEMQELENETGRGLIDLIAEAAEYVDYRKPSKVEKPVQGGTLESFIEIYDEYRKICKEEEYPWELGYVLIETFRSNEEDLKESSIGVYRSSYLRYYNNDDDSFIEKKFEKEPPLPSPKVLRKRDELRACVQNLFLSFPGYGLYEIRQDLNSHQKRYENNVRYGEHFFRIAVYESIGYDMEAGCYQKPLSSRFDTALVYASEIHRMQGNNRNSAPYISHLLAASSIVLEHRGTEDQAISALLHDSIKYGPRYTKRSAEQIRQEIQEKLGREVLAIVESCSDINTNSNLSWRQQKEQFIARISNASTLVRLVSAADKLHKARTILNNYRKDWNNYNYEGEKEDILWYFNALIEAFSNKGDIPELVEKLSQVVEELKRVTGETESSDIGEP